ncbi:MAG TPA: DUF6151 family protein [Bdellovibrionales bacterium]|nr:DUF6151 family protein [Bdellovibrionales bacterium]
MEIQCECGKFRAELTGFPRNTPGRLKCYCDDCQAYLHFLNRADLLDEHGGSEVIPAYPSEFKLIAGKELLKCTRLIPAGMFRFSTTCCNTPIVNTDPKRPWAGIHRRMFTAKDPLQLDKALGPVKSSIMGKFAKGTPPAGTPQKFDFKGMTVVMPYLLKGMILGKAKGSPFFENGQSVATPKVLTADEFREARARAGF